MIHTSSSTQTLSRNTQASSQVKAKRLAQMTAAATLSFGLVGTFSLPAYASAPEVEGRPDGFSHNQTLETVNVEPALAPLTAPDGSVDEEILKQERLKREQEERLKLQEQQSRAYSGADIPAGEGAQGIVQAALAQIGVTQDCTLLVENSLRAIGIPAGDLGTQIAEYTSLGGTLITSGDYAPGDVLVWSGRHVAVYIGNGQAVHGGFNGNRTVVASAFLDGAPSGVVRFG